MGRSEEHIAAYRAIEDAKDMIRHRRGANDFSNAVTKIKEAIKIYPKLINGQKMLTVCEILHMSTTFKPKPDQETWPYALLKIPSSSSESKVKSRYRQLVDDMKTLKYNFPNAIVAVKFLENSMNLYNRKVNFDEDDDEDEDGDGDDDDEEEEEEEEKKSDNDATADDSTGGDDSDDDVDPFARSPVFKKLRREIFTALPQNPDFSPFSKYCPRVREEIKEGFDVTFVKLIQKFQNLGDTLWHEDEDTIRGELSNLEEMGYDVKKLRERFDSLVELAKKDRDMENELDAINRDEVVQLGIIQSCISELEKEKELSQTQRIKLKSEIAALKSKVDEQGDMGNMLEEFKSIGKEIWK